MKLDITKPVRWKARGDHSIEYIGEGKKLLAFEVKHLESGGVFWVQGFTKTEVDKYLENIPPEPRRKKIYIVWCPENQMVHATFCVPSSNNAEESANAYAELNNRNHIKLQVQEVELVEKV